MILTFEDSEEEILNHIISYVSTGVKVFQEVEYAMALRQDLVQNKMRGSAS